MKKIKYFFGMVRFIDKDLSPIVSWVFTTNFNVNQSKIQYKIVPASLNLTTLAGSRSEC